MDCLIALLGTRGRTATVRQAISLERLITRAADRVLRRATPSAILTIRMPALALVRRAESPEISD